jgi:predicted RNase H-like HicB family nuclease
MFKYSVQLFWSENDQEYVALVPEFPYLSVLDKKPDRAVREAVMVTKAVLEGFAERGIQPPEPQVLSSYSGQIRVRMPRTLHQKLAGRARREDVSLNTLIVSLLAEGVGAMEELPLVERNARRPKRKAVEVESERLVEPEAAPGKRTAAGEKR